MFLKRGSIVLVGMTLMVILATSSGLAATWYGSTGLFRTPTADVLQEGAVRVGGHGLDHAVSASVGYGIFEGVEIAVVSLQRPGLSRFTGSIKGRVFTETESRPALATGIVDGSVYGVMSKQFIPRLRLHLGVGTKQSVFAGLSYLVNPVVVSRPGELAMPRVTLLAEYEQGDVNLGTQLTFTDRLEAYLTWVGFDRVAIGATWQF